MDQRQPHRNIAQYLTIGEAAELLGVSPWTLRNWDSEGKLTALRHPCNGYRLYRREDLEAILRSKCLGDRLHNRLSPGAGWTDVADSEHIVQFYETDAFLVGCMTQFIGAALDAGDGAVVIATGPHRTAIQRKLRGRGLNLSVARARGQFLSLDAGETLAKFMVGASADPVRFREEVGGVIARVGAGCRRVRAFGEMVALLWAAGEPSRAIRLEELWNDLRDSHPFALCCAYPLHDFGGVDLDTPFENVCACHSRVIPAESYAALTGEGEHLQAVARLQRKAQALEAEVTRRKEVEARLVAVQERRRTEPAESKRLREGCGENG